MRLENESLIREVSTDIDTDALTCDRPWQWNSRLENCFQLENVEKLINGFVAFNFFAMRVEKICYSENTWCII